MPAPLREWTILNTHLYEHEDLGVGSRASKSLVHREKIERDRIGRTVCKVSQWKVNIPLLVKL